MRADFAKQLTERERHNHRDHYGNYRKMNVKALNDPEAGGRESMKIRYKIRGHDKSFNENLNPLYGWIRSCLGKKWDKCYSELRQQFDARKVINNHILEHLFQDIEIHTYVGEKGAIMFMDTRYTNKGVQPIKECYKDYYVCPKSGLLRKTHKQPRRSLIKQQEADKVKHDLETRREIDSGVLRLVDGIWYHFEMHEVPVVTRTFVNPGTRTTLYKTGYRYGPGIKEKTWDELNQSDRERHGKLVLLGGTAIDAFTGEKVYRDQNGWLHMNGRYMNGKYSKNQAAHVHANRTTASHKQLKQAGLAK